MKNKNSLEVIYFILITSRDFISLNINKVLIFN